MKKTISVLVTCCAMAFASQAFGQACTANAAISGPGALSPSTCDGTAQLLSTCGNATPMSGAKQYIYSVTLGNGATGSLSVKSAVIAPYIGLMNAFSGACNSQGTCGGSRENAGNAGDDVAIPLTGIPAGDYYLVIADTGTSCGAVAVTVAPTLPVELKNFSID